MSLFDICPDLEELIVDELKVLTKYRDAVKEFKTRMELGKKALNLNYKDHNNVGSLWRATTYKIRYGIPRNIIHTLFPKYGKQNNHHGSYYQSLPMKYVEMANIHGFLYSFGGQEYDKWWSRRDSGRTMTVENLNKVLTELGATKFKSKKKPDKIKLLMKY